jgi:hypothetical protein
MHSKIFVFISLIFQIKYVYAYIDPGSGSVYLQIIFSIIIAIVFWFKNITIIIKSFFKNIIKKLNKK